MHIGKTVAKGPGGVAGIQEQREHLVAEEENDHGDEKGEDDHHEQGGPQALLDPVILAAPMFWAV